MFYLHLHLNLDSIFDMRRLLLTPRAMHNPTENCSVPMRLLFFER